MEVNRELPNLADGLDESVHLLGPGGRVLVLAYHSLEDRIVKQTFARWAGEDDASPRRPPSSRSSPTRRRALARPLTRRPRRPTADEIAANPRAESARLRAAERVIELPMTAVPAPDALGRARAPARAPHVSSGRRPAISASPRSRAAGAGARVDRLGVRAVDRARACSSSSRSTSSRCSTRSRSTSSRSSSHTEELRYERLRAEVATLSSPPAIVDAAKRMGMQAPQTVDYIDAPAAATRRGDAGSDVEHAGRGPRRGEAEP